jgi:hypothetical protein
VESEGAFGEVDCCLEHATRANALRHNKRRLRFMEITSLYVGDKKTAPAPSQRRVEPIVPCRKSCSTPFLT